MRAFNRKEGFILEQSHAGSLKTEGAKYLNEV